jgi:hypothetical protein
MLTAPPPAPEAYSATIRRSDGGVTKLWITSVQKRIEYYLGDQLQSVIISDSEAREIRNYTPATRECLVTPMPPPGTEVWHPDGDAKLTPETSEMIDGRPCTRFGVDHGHGTTELRWYDEGTGLHRRVQTFDLTGKPALTLDWLDVQIGTPPSSVFNPLPGYREFKIPPQRRRR